MRGLVVCAGISGVGTLALALFAVASFRRIRSAMQATGEHPVGSAV